MLKPHIFLRQLPDGHKYPNYWAVKTIGVHENIILTNDEVILRAKAWYYVEQRNTNELR